MISGVFVTVCVSVCPCCKRKMASVSTPNLVDIQCMMVTWHALTMRCEGQGHAVIKYTADVGMHVGRTA